VVSFGGCANLAAAPARTGNDARRSPAGLPALRRAIADKLARENGVRVDPARDVSQQVILEIGRVGAPEYREGVRPLG